MWTYEVPIDSSKAEYKQVARLSIANNGKEHRTTYHHEFLRPIKVAITPTQRLNQLWI